VDINKRVVANYQRKLARLSQNITELCKLYDLVADPTRLKILLLTKYNNKLCVSEIAEILGISVSGISHQLNTMEKTGLVTRRKKGKIVCYSPDKKIIKLLPDFTK
jgi:DNA-binding transcriptional ArsR family regulator